jgi:hypothetical protein
MANVKTRFGLLVAVAAAVAGVAAFVAAQASASSAPIVISYEKECDAAGHCEGTAESGGELGKFEMQVSPPGPRPTGKAAHLTLTEWITVGGISFTAEMNGSVSPAGFIVLNGTVTEGEFAGSQIHQRSNFAGINGNKTVWTGELQLMPASA